jgi:hypothetical protein
MDNEKQQTEHLGLSDCSSDAYRPQAHCDCDDLLVAIKDIQSGTLWNTVFIWFFFVLEMFYIYWKIEGWSK